jgi:hypothetical protein
MNIILYTNVTNNNNYSLLNISNSTNNNKYINYRLNYNMVWILFLFIFIFYIPIIILILDLLKKLCNDIIVSITKILFYRQKRNTFILKMGIMNHKIVDT